MDPKGSPAVGGDETFPHANTASLGELAYAKIRRLVMSGAARPGSVIREASLVRDLAMSRTPVREALRRLQAEKLLQPVPRGGYLVIEMTRDELVDVYSVRAALEGLAAALAAERRTRTDLAKLADLLDAMDDAVGKGDDPELASLNSAFHQAIALASHNICLVEMLSTIHEIFDRYRMRAVRNRRRREEAHDQHRSLHDAIVNGLSDKAEATARLHVSAALALRLKRMLAE